MNQNKNQKKFFLSHKKSSAMIISLAFHSIIFIGAIFFVVVSTQEKKDGKFIPKLVTRPKMKPRKIQIPKNIKKQKPRPRIRRLLISKRTTQTKIVMPEIIGIVGGIGNSAGTGLDSLGFNFDLTIFGGNDSSGNGFAGTFFDLKQTQEGKPIKMNNNEYVEAVKNFTHSWKLTRFKKYFRAPQQKFATFFAIPRMSASAAPEAYNVADTVKPKYWLAYYKGFFTAPETGTYRFCGFADDLLIVRAKRRIVLDASYPVWEGKFTKWHSRDKNNRKYPLSGMNMVIGDWIKLKKGQSEEIGILLGESPGGIFSCRLLIEQKGKIYKQVPYTYKDKNGEMVTGKRPILPIFKTKEIPSSIINKLKINPNEMTTTGPTFGSD